MTFDTIAMVLVFCVRSYNVFLFTHIWFCIVSVLILRLILTICFLDPVIFMALFQFIEMLFRISNFFEFE